jgi:hypothetical protein
MRYISITAVLLLMALTLLLHVSRRKQEKHQSLRTQQGNSNQVKSKESLVDDIDSNVHGTIKDRRIILKEVDGISIDGGIVFDPENRKKSQTFSDAGKDKDKHTATQADKNDEPTLTITVANNTLDKVDDNKEEVEEAAVVDKEKTSQVTITTTNVHINSTKIENNTIEQNETGVYLVVVNSKNEDEDESLEEVNGRKHNTNNNEQGNSSYSSNVTQEVDDGSLNRTEINNQFLDTSTVFIGTVRKPPRNNS